MDTSAVCPRCGKSDVQISTLSVLANAYYECRDCGQLWKIPAGHPTTGADPQDSSSEQVHPFIPNCPNCLMPKGQPFEVEAGPGYSRLAYRCENCQYTFAERIYLSPKTPPR